MLNEFLKTVVNTKPALRAAYLAAREAHKGEKRKNGEFFLDHSLETARLVSLWGADDVTIAAALLHDIVQKPTIHREALFKDAGDEVAFLLDRFLKVSAVRYNGLQQNVMNVRHLLLYLAEDIRVLLVRLASRFHNMQSLYVFPLEDQKRIALETMDVFAPLAYELGMRRLSSELEDLAFPYIYPKEYNWLMGIVRERREELEEHLETLKPALQDALRKEDVKVVAIESRAKHYASLYRKLLRYDMDIERIYDLVALRIITEDVGECYTTLGVVNTLWDPVSGRMKDYIANPKSNGYRSIHTTVITPGDRFTEVQIRTKDMHEFAEWGIAAHLGYAMTKGTRAYALRKVCPVDSRELAILQQLNGWNAEYSPDKSEHRSLQSLFAERVLVLTPKGDVIELPKGATPVDFSYRIHSEVGNHAVGAKVNGAIVPLNHTLSSGDMVEILVQKNKAPSSSWLRFVKTSQARHHVNAAIKGMRGMLGNNEEKKSTRITLQIEQKPGIAKTISSTFASAGVPIQSLSFLPKSLLNRHASLLVLCRILNGAETDRLTGLLKKVDAVRKVSVVRR